MKPNVQCSRAAKVTRFINMLFASTLFGLLGLASACNPAIGNILTSQESGLFENQLRSIGSNAASVLNLHDNLCSENGKALFISAGVKLAGQFCWPSTAGINYLPNMMNQVTQTDVERMVDCFCTAITDVDTSNSDLNEIITTVAAAVSNPSNAVTQLTSTSFLDLVKRTVLSFQGDVCNGACRDTWGRIIIILKGPSLINVGDDILSDAEAYDPWDCMCGMEVGYLFDKFANLVTDLRPILRGNTDGTVIAQAAAKGGMVVTQFFLRPGGMCPKPITSWILLIILLPTTTLIAACIAIRLMGRKAPNKGLATLTPKKPADQTASASAAVPGQVAGISPGQVQLASGGTKGKFDPQTGQPIPKFDPRTGVQNWS